MVEHCFIKLSLFNHPISCWMNMACHLTACVNFSFYFDQGQTFSSNIYSTLDQSRRQNKVFDSLAGDLKSLTWRCFLISEGLAKVGNIVAHANVSQFSRAGNMCCWNKFCCSETKNVFAWSQKHFCFPDTNFASETYVSQFSHPRKHNKKHCFRNNVS